MILHANAFADSTVAHYVAEYSMAGSSSILVGGGPYGNALYTAAGGTVDRALGASPSTVFQAFRFKAEAFSDSANACVRFREGSTYHVALHFDSSGKVNAYRGNLATLLGSTESGVLNTSYPVWLQVKVVIHDSAGSIEIRDSTGAVILSLTGIDTRNGGTGVCDNAGIGSVQLVGTSGWWSDWVVWDTTGDGATDWIYECVVSTHRVTADGDATDFTPSSGTAASCVDEADFNATDTISSGTPGDQALFTVDAMTHNPSVIYGIVRTVVAQKDDAGAMSLKHITKIGGVTTAGSAIALTDSVYVRLEDVEALNPDTGLAWTQATFNTAQRGVEAA